MVSHKFVQTDPWPSMTLRSVSTQTDPNMDDFEFPVPKVNYEVVDDQDDERYIHE